MNVSNSKLHTETRKKVSSVWKGKGKHKKKVQQHMTVRSIGENRKCSKNTDLFGWGSGMQKITDQFGDGCHKFNSNIFVGQQSKALLGDGVT